MNTSYAIDYLMLYAAQIYTEFSSEEREIIDEILKSSKEIEKVKAEFLTHDPYTREQKIDIIFSWIESDCNSEEEKFLFNIGEKAFQWGKIEKTKKLVTECLESGETSLNLGRLQFGDLTNIPELRKCTHLKELDLLSNEVYTIDSLEYLTGLEKLTLGGFRIKNLGGLSRLENLKELTLFRLGDNVSLGPLANLYNLITLNIENTRKVNDIKQVRHLRSLEVLKVSNSSDDTEWLENLTSLKELVFTDSKLTSRPLKRHIYFIIN